MKPAIVGVTDDGVVFGPDATTLAAWALTQHQAECRECGNPNGDSRCGRGERYTQAAASSSDDIPSFPSL